MTDPYTRPSRFTTRGSSQPGEEPQQREAPRRSSQQREAPQQDTSAQRWWEDHRSSPGSPDEPQEAEDDEPYFEKEDHVQEEAAALWIEEDQIQHDYLIDQSTSLVPATNPWVLYEAGVICSRGKDGSLDHKSSGERVINLREWSYRPTDQRVKLRHQGIRRPEWEKLP